MWFRSQLLPALRELERTAKTTSERRALSGAYYVAGDVHDLNGAPKAAIAAYRSSLRFDPTEAAAWREIGGMLENMGRRVPARHALQRALDLDPGDEHSQRDMLGLKSASSRALFREGNPVWETDELLARGRLEEAFTRSRKLRGIKGFLASSRALGALGESEAVLRTWDRIVESSGDVELGPGDWFFLPASTFDAAPFWRSLWRLGGRLRAGWFVSSDTLASARSAARRRPLDEAKVHQRLMIRYNLARTRRDATALRRLLQRYPSWKEPRATLGRLERRE